MFESHGDLAISLSGNSHMAFLLELSLAEKVNKILATPWRFKFELVADFAFALARCPALLQQTEYSYLGVDKKYHQHVNTVENCMLCLVQDCYTDG